LPKNQGKEAISSIYYQGDELLIPKLKYIKWKVIGEDWVKPCAGLDVSKDFDSV